MTPGKATPLPLMDQVDTRGRDASGLVRNLVRKKDAKSQLLAQAVQQSQARRDKKKKKGRTQGLVNAIKRVVGGSRRQKKDPKASQRKRSRIKLEPDPSDDPDEDGESSSYHESESELSYEPPLRRKAAKSPGSVMQMLIRHANEQMDRGSLTEESLRQDESVVGGVKISTYFALLIRPYYPAGSPLLRELYSLAQTIDLLRAGMLPEAADSLAARFVSVHTALAEGNWSTAAHLELHPLEAVASASTATMLMAQKHKRLVLKSQGFTSSQSRAWGYQQGKGRGGAGYGKGRKGDYQDKGKGKNKTKRGGSWNNKGENPWKANKDEPPKEK